MSFFKILKANRRTFLYILTLFLLTVTFSSSLLYVSYKYERAILSFTYLQWLLVFVALNFAMSLSLTSTTIAALLCGYFLGWSALIIYIIVYLLATITGNIIAKQIDKGSFIETLKNIGSTQRYLFAIEEEQFGLIVLARISPIFPFAIMNVFLAAVDFRIGKILLGSLVGMLPRTVICFWIGSQFHQLRLLIDQGMDDNLLQISMIVLVLVSLIGFYVYINQILKKVGKKYL
jgi:uncharacterized membrane protein YdjX (TVP38/TMEM64 family)